MKNTKTRYFVAAFNDDVDASAFNGLWKYNKKPVGGSISTMSGITGVKVVKYLILKPLRDGYAE